MESKGNSINYKYLLATILSCHGRVEAGAPRSRTLRSLERQAYNFPLPQQEPIPPKLTTILVVDDDEGMRETLGAILKKEYRVKLAVTGEETLAVLKREDGLARAGLAGAGRAVAGGSGPRRGRADRGRLTNAPRARRPRSRHPPRVEASLLTRGWELGTLLRWRNPLGLRFDTVE